MYGVFVVRPDGAIECWTTDSVDQWRFWAMRLEEESADYFAFA